MNNNQEKTVEKIRNQYTEKQYTKIDALRDLDKKIKRPANVFAYIFGSVSAIVMGCGMSLIMTDIGSIIKLTNVYPVGIAVGVIGLALTALNYPIYKRILNSRKKKYGKQILKLTDEITSAEN